MANQKYYKQPSDQAFPIGTVIDSSANKVVLQDTKTERIVSAAKLVAALFDNAKRCGQPKDYPEGNRFVIFSDTLANQISSWLRNGK